MKDKWFLVHLRLNPVGNILAYMTGHLWLCSSDLVFFTAKFDFVERVWSWQVCDTFAIVHWMSSSVLTGVSVLISGFYRRLPGSSVLPLLCISVQIYNKNHYTLVSLSFPRDWGWPRCLTLNDDRGDENDVTLNSCSRFSGVHVCPGWPKRLWATPNMHWV